MAFHLMAQRIQLSINPNFGLCQHLVQKRHAVKITSVMGVQQAVYLCFIVAILLFNPCQTARNLGGCYGGIFRQVIQVQAVQDRSGPCKFLMYPNTGLPNDLVALFRCHMQAIIFHRHAQAFNDNLPLKHTGFNVGDMIAEWQEGR